MTAMHLDYETLADLSEGLLDEGRAASARAHVSTCDVCRGRADDLEHVSRVLAETPTPPMPADLVSRLDAAIANEASRAPAELTHRPRRRFQVLSAAAAAAVVIGGGVIAVQAVTGDSDSNSPASGAAPKPADPKHKSSATDKEQTFSNAPNGAATYPHVASGTDYTSKQLSTQIAATQHGSTMGRKQATTAKLTGCVNRVAAGRRVEFVDNARFNGKPATLIVLSAAAAKKPLDVWIVGPQCSADSTDLITRTSVKTAS